MRILTLTDSLALPRIKPEKCSFEQTWPQLLKKEGYDIYQVSIGGATISDLVKQSNYHKLFNPNILILQAGIVDCSPRFMSKLEQKLVNKIPKVRGALFKILNRPKIRKFRHISYTPLELFSKNLKNLKTVFNCRIISIGIATKSKKYELILPGITDNVNKYNQVLEKIFKENYIDISTMPPSHFMSDYHHLNNKGHKFIFDELRLKLNA